MLERAKRAKATLGGAEASKASQVDEASEPTCTYTRPKNEQNGSVVSRGSAANGDYPVHGRSCMEIKVEIHTLPNQARI